ncbi:MAG: polyprenol monophosphomannose synthase [Planctomycetota bacterium]|nr:MAG: polyprenol monophosphomannose synthase [Planctomycetota bacterium]
MLLVALATYNEIETLPSLVGAIREHLPHADVLVVDDNSPDGTGRWCDQQAAHAAWFSVIHRPGKLGLGSASWAAMQAAIDRGYELLITLDADWSHPPAALPSLVAAAAHADVVIGSRYCPGGRIEGWPLSRRIISAGMNMATRLALGLPVRDSTGACRVYRVAALRRLDFSELTATGYAYLEEILWQLHRRGASFAEAPITFTDRRAGASKVHLGEALGKLRVLARLARSRLFQSPRAPMPDAPP